MHKHFIVFSVHMLIWSGFLWAMDLAAHDHIRYRIIFMAVVFYISYYIAAQVLQNKQLAAGLSILNFLLFFGGRALYLWVFYYL
ncbi:hypothetical protein [Bacillus marinisedimentorum]|uniref:hypothetical protein n=1 Tax=Bacillus marinisedimentorum TaxID=1821260 RepID=UPI0007DE547C|nr:hypothetical protein [Bacillus marinisedimentorum]